MPKKNTTDSSVHTADDEFAKELEQNNLAFWSVFFLSAGRADALI